MQEEKRSLVSFNLRDYRTGKFTPTTLGGEVVTILSVNYDDEHYKIAGHIGQSTQLETWTMKGKYYHKEGRRESTNNLKNLLLQK